MQPKSPRVSLKQNKNSPRASLRVKNENNAISPIPPLRISLESKQGVSPIKHERNGKIDKTITVSPRLETEVDITIIKADEKRPRSKVHVDVNASNYYESITKSNRALESD